MNGSFLENRGLMRGGQKWQIFMKNDEKSSNLPFSRGGGRENENLDPDERQFLGGFSGFFPKVLENRRFLGYLSSKKRKPLHCAQLIY